MGCDWRMEESAERKNFAVVVGRVLRGLNSQRGLVQDPVTGNPVTLLAVVTFVLLQHLSSTLHNDNIEH
eukprot:scaffold8045_cov111-Skeletonema_dohrnii-CCMP3373.AAC.3